MTIYMANELLVLVSDTRYRIPAIFFQGNHRPMDIRHPGTMCFSSDFRPKVIYKDLPPLTWAPGVDSVSTFNKLQAFFNTGLYTYDVPVHVNR